MVHLPSISALRSDGRNLAATANIRHLHSSCRSAVVLESMVRHPSFPADKNYSNHGR